MNQSYFMPYFNIKYFEYDNQVENSCELCSNLVIIDGFFYPGGETNKFCLGYQFNLNQNATSQNYLSKLGLFYIRNKIVLVFII
jgi:hypothetical protein